MRLTPSNQRIALSGEDAVRALRELELVVVSLTKVASYYAAAGADGGDTSAYEHETTQFIDQWQVTQRLAEVRRILAASFDSTVGDDDMDDLEREMSAVPNWSRPGDLPPESAGEKSYFGLHQ